MNRNRCATGAPRTPSVRCLWGAVVYAPLRDYPIGRGRTRIGHSSSARPPWRRKSHDSWLDRAEMRSSRRMGAELSVRAAVALLESVAEELPVQGRGVDPEDFAGPLLLPAG